MVTSVTTLILFFVNHNYKLAFMQDMDIEARYLAMSGVEMTYMALVKEIPAGGTTKRVIDKFKTDTTPLTNPVLPASVLGIVDNEGTIKITVRIYNNTTDSSDPLNGGGNVQIISQGTSRRNGTKTYSVTASAVISIEDRNKLQYNVKID